MDQLFAESPPNPEKSHILMLEDQANIRIKARDCILNRGYKVDMAATLEQAVYALKRTIYQRILIGFSLNQDDRHKLSQYITNHYSENTRPLLINLPEDIDKAINSSQTNNLQELFDKHIGSEH